MHVTLVVLEGPLKGRSFVFERHDTFIVGRSRFVHCPMPEDMALSRDHFMIEINPPQCEIRDLGSTNGTFVNNNRVDRAGWSRVTSSRRDRASSGLRSSWHMACRLAKAVQQDSPRRTRSRRGRFDAQGAVRWHLRI